MEYRRRRRVGLVVMLLGLLSVVSVIFVRYSHATPICQCNRLL